MFKGLKIAFFALSLGLAPVTVAYAYDLSVPTINEGASAAQSPKKGDGTAAPAAPICTYSYNGLTCGTGFSVYCPGNNSCYRDRAAAKADCHGTYYVASCAP